MIVISRPIMVMTAKKHDLLKVFHNIFILILATFLYYSFISLSWNFLPQRKLRANPKIEKSKVMIWMSNVSHR